MVAALSAPRLQTGEFTDAIRPDKNNCKINRKRLVRGGKTWYDRSNETNKRQDMGDGSPPCPYAGESDSPTQQRCCTQVPIIPVLRVFFNRPRRNWSSVKAVILGDKLSGQGFVSIHTRCRVILSCTAFYLSRRDGPAGRGDGALSLPGSGPAR